MQKRKNYLIVSLKELKEVFKNLNDEIEVCKEVKTRKFNKNYSKRYRVDKNKLLRLLKYHINNSEKTIVRESEYSIYLYIKKKNVTYTFFIYKK